jgi:hypothetical protein
MATVRAFGYSALAASRPEKDTHMSLRAEMEALRGHLDDLARTADDSLTKRYTLRRPPLPPGLYWQLRWLAGRILRGLEALHILRPDPWPVSLKQAATSAGARPLLIWAVGTDRGMLREACGGFSRMQDSLPGFALVLVTDVADFAFFSRLGWLVEYLPELAGQGEAYEDRKARLLARLYRGAPVLPVRAGLESGSRAEEIRRWVASCD